LPSSVIVKMSAPGFHRWPVPNTNQSAYLSYQHRHLFVFRVAFKVMHDNRAIEFHQALSWLRTELTLLPSVPLGTDTIIDFGGLSCEMIAKDLYRKIKAKHVAPKWVEVWEDDEFGARYEL